MSPHRILLAVAFAALLAPPGRAEDVVSVRYLPGHPLPDQSVEWTDLRIARHPPAASAARKAQEIDRFFDEVAAALKESGIDQDWQLAIPDAPAIEITIDLGGKRLKLVSCHTLLEKPGNYLVTQQGGRAVPDREKAAELAKQSESFRRRRRAFEKILALALERTRATLAPRAIR